MDQQPLKEKGPRRNAFIGNVGFLRCSYVERKEEERKNDNGSEKDFDNGIRPRRQRISPLSASMFLVSPALLT